MIDAESMRRHVLRCTLEEHIGEELTGDLIEQLVDKLHAEITSIFASWAFKESEVGDG